jgi:hypothetical protein
VERLATSLLLPVCILAACSAEPVIANQSHAETARVDSNCFDLRSPSPRITVTGKLSLHSFPGPPNYESIADGDTEERTYILELPRMECADDGGELVGRIGFDRVHVSVSDAETGARLWRELRAALGKEVTISGEAIGHHTGHHHAPVVMFADQISVR